MTIDRFPCLLMTFHDYQVFLASTFPMIQPEFLRGSYGAAVGAEVGVLKNTFVAKYHRETKENIHGSLLLCSS